MKYLLILLLLTGCMGGGLPEGNMTEETGKCRAGDLNQDTLINDYDLSQLSNLVIWFNSGKQIRLGDCTMIAADINKDGKIDSEDYSQLCTILGKSCPK